MFKALKSFKILKSFRAIKTAKIISSISYLQKILKSLVRSLPGIFWIFMMLAVLYYIYALIGTNLFNDIVDTDGNPLFNTLWKSLGSLFQLMTYDNWNNMMNAVLKKYPLAWMYFISFVLITAFILMQVVTGIVVDAVKSVDLNDDDTGLNQVHRNIDDLSKQIDNLTIEIRRLKNQFYSGESNARKKGLFKKIFK